MYVSIYMCVRAGVLVVCVTKVIFKASTYRHTVYINTPYQCMWLLISTLRLIHDVC